MLDSDVYTTLGLTEAVLGANQFRAAARTTAVDADDRIVFDTRTGALYYDAEASVGQDRYISLC